MYCKDINYFGLLTAEEQLADIKEYWYNSSTDTNDTEAFSLRLTYPVPLLLLKKAILMIF